MEQEEIDWGRSIEQQIEQIITATASARKLVRQLARKKDAHPELITKENYTYFQSVISSTAQLVYEVERSPFYKDALDALRNERRRKQQRIIARHFGHLFSRDERSH
jgi:hypothetical protein